MKKESRKQWREKGEERFEIRHEIYVKQTGEE